MWQKFGESRHHLCHTKQHNAPTNSTKFSNNNLHTKYSEKLLFPFGRNLTGATWMLSLTSNLGMFILIKGPSCVYDSHTTPTWSRCSGVNTRSRPNSDQVLRLRWCRLQEEGLRCTVYTPPLRPQMSGPPNSNSTHLLSLHHIRLHRWW